MTEASGTRIVINTTLRRLFFYRGQQLVKIYPVAVGKPSTPTPQGHYKIINKIINPGGILGTRWMGLSIPGGNYGIHGTNNHASIGNAVSLGCVRMYNHHVEELFPQVRIGTPVYITTARNGESANKGPAPPGQPAANTGRRHVVKPGESLWQIATRYGIPLEEVIAANKLTNPELIYPGQEIIIPNQRQNS